VGKEYLNKEIVGKSETMYIILHQCDMDRKEYSLWTIQNSLLLF